MWGGTFVRACVCVCVCVPACMPGYIHACVRVCAYMYIIMLQYRSVDFKYR